MPISNSRFYSDPNLGAAFNNIASMFAPPDSADLANYATARAKNQGSDIIAKLAADPRYSGFDNQAILADLYDPTQSFAKVGIDDATTRRGQDLTASTSISNNAADNRTTLIGKMYGPLSQGDVRPELPQSIGSLFGVNQTLPQVAGAPKPLSETEVKGGILTSQIPNLSQSQLTGIAMGDTPVENIVGANGQPEVSLRSDAVGKQPYFNKGADAKPENAVALMADGRTQVPAIQGEDGRWYNAQTKDLLPTNIQIFKVPQAQGTAADVGLTKATTGDVEQQLIDIAITKDTANKLRSLIAAAPSSQGAVGWLRGTAQNVIETGGELGGFFGGKLKEVTDDIASGAADAGLAGAFDPNIPAIDMMSNLLAFEYAKTTTGNRQLSNEMLRASKSALGLDKLDANQKDSLARLDQAIASIQSQEDILNEVRDRGLNSVSAPAAKPPVTGMADGSTMPPGWDAEDWKYLTDDEKQQALNGG